MIREAETLCLHSTERDCVPRPQLVVQGDHSVASHLQVKIKPGQFNPQSVNHIFISNLSFFNTLIEYDQLILGEVRLK